MGWREDESLVVSLTGESRWIDLFYQHLHVYFATLRDVYRFLAAFEFHAGVFRQGGSFEVNIVDLFVLEILSMFEPQQDGRIQRFLVRLEYEKDRIPLDPFDAEP